MASALHARPKNITAIAADYGLRTMEVRTLVNEHMIPSYRVGMNRFVDPTDLERLDRIIRRHLKRKARVTP
jgi:hypothetical protein